MVKGIIVAGNYQQYKDFASHLGLNPNEYKYVSQSEQIMGLHNIEILYAGEYWKNLLMRTGELRNINYTPPKSIWRKIKDWLCGKR